jgi:uncharacterized protein (DUF433 family)
MHERIWVDAQIHFGKPCVKGTRIPVLDILELIRDGISFGDISRKYYLELTVEDIRACMQFAIDVMDSDKSHLTRLIELMEAYVKGQDRSRLMVRQIEGEFALSLDDDERFEELQYVLAMFGAEGFDMEERLIEECEWALKTLSGMCVYRDCKAPIIEGTRYCVAHTPD